MNSAFPLTSILKTLVLPLFISASVMTASGASPVKIIILAGQSNMLGKGTDAGETTPGPLDYIVANDPDDGWSKAWKISMWARLHDGESAHRLLREMIAKDGKPVPTKPGPDATIEFSTERGAEYRIRIDQ